MARTYLVNDELDPIADGKIGDADLVGGGHSADTDAHHAQQHALDGADHTVSGLTTGHVLQATSATTFAFDTAPAGTPASTVTDETSFGIAAAVGTDSEYARQDHTHGSPTNPVTAHTADASAHHAKYLDSEAITAVEGEATLDLTGAVTSAGSLQLSHDLTNGTGDTYDLGAWTSTWADVFARWVSLRALATANSPGIEMYRERTGSATVIATDWIGEWDMYGWDGVSNLSGPGIYGQVDSISVGTMTSSLHFRDGAWADTWYINNDGDFIPGSTTKDIGASGTRVQDIYSATLDTSGNITVGGTVDGVDIAAHAASATAHHTKYTDAEAITAVEGEATLALSGAITSATSITSTGAITGARLDAVNAAGYAFAELNGSSGSYVDIHGPTSVDYGARIQVFADSGGTGDGTLGIQAGTVDMNADLNLASYDITSVVDITATGNIAVSGTVDGVDIAAHAASSTAHHTKYTDAEAVDAVEAAGLTLATTKDILFAVDGTNEFGTNASRAQTIYTDTLQTGTLANFGSNITLHDNLIPDTDGIHQIGDSTYYLQDIYTDALNARTPWNFYGYKSTAQNLSGGGSAVDITFGTALYDPDDLDEGAGTDTFLRIGNKLGWWLILYQMHIANNATGYRQIMLVKNDSTNHGVTRIDADLTGTPLWQTFCVVEATASSDYIRFRALQNSGSTLAIQTGQGSTWRGAIYLGNDT